MGSRMICIADLYGLGGRTTSPGMLTLAGKIKQLGTNFTVLGPYDQDAWPLAAADLAARPSGDLIGAVGYSLGANNVVQIAARLKRKVDYLAGIQPSVWGAGCFPLAPTIALPANVRSARCVYNPTWLDTIGLGYGRYGAPAILTANSDLHPAVDNDAGVHGLVLNDLKQLA